MPLTTGFLQVYFSCPHVTEWKRAYTTRCCHRAIFKTTREAPQLSSRGTCRWIDVDTPSQTALSAQYLHESCLRQLPQKFGFYTARARLSRIEHGDAPFLVLYITVVRIGVRFAHDASNTCQGTAQASIDPCRSEVLTAPQKRTRTNNGRTTKGQALIFTFWSPLSWVKIDEALLSASCTRNSYPMRLRLFLGESPFLPSSQESAQTVEDTAEHSQGHCRITCESPATFWATGTGG